MKFLTLRVRTQKGTHRVQVPLNLTASQLYEAVKANEVIKKELGNAFELALDPQGTHRIPNDPTTQLPPLENGSFIFLFSEKHTKTQTNLDDVLLISDARVAREKGASCTTHGPRGMCDHCRPLEPYEEAAQGDAKHLSLHAFLHKQTALRSPFPQYEYSINERHRKYCSTLHASYPKGLCTKCQPAAIALQRQPFRCTDHVEFGDSQQVDAFIGGWRKSGMQRFAWLLGNFEVYEGVPLGVKAKIVSLYEPPQENAIDGFRLLTDHQENSLLGIVKEHGLEVVGMIYTDLQPDPERPALVLNKRNSDAYFLSSTECYFIAQKQVNHPVAFNLSSFPSFSRFVTCLVTGNEEGRIDVFCYQVSLQAEALLKTGIVLPSTDPNWMLLGSEDPSCFVPSVLYTKENEYGVKVPHCDDSKFPVEYLIVTLSHGFSTSPDISKFDINALLNSKSPDKNKSPEVIELSDNENPPGWACDHCTFINIQSSSSTNAVCEMCGLPRFH